MRIPGGDAEDLNDVKEIRIDDRGRIVLAGWDYAGPGTASTKLVRLLADGRRDGSFGERGIVLLDVEPGRSEYLAGMVIQPTGRIVLGGTYSTGPQPRDTAVYLAALTTTGEPDLTFGDAGTTRTALGRRSSINDLQMTQQGRLVGAGFVRHGDQLAVARWRANGSLDRSFGERGVVRTSFRSVTNAYRVAVAPDGTLIVGASRDPSTHAGPALLRLTLDGAIDPSYGEDGLADLDDEPFGAPDALVVQPDGKAIAVHETGFPSNDVLITRLGTDGTRDPTFGDDGDATILTGDDDRAWHIALDPAGRLLVTASIEEPREPRRAVVLRVLT